MAGEDTVSLVETLLVEDKRPTEAQELEIRKAIPSLREDVLKTEREFNEVDIALAIIPPEQTPDAHLTEQFERLKVRLDKARDRLANHTKSIAYGLQIPVEVLEVIFRHCLPETDYIEPNRLQAPLLLCQICSSWRRVALLTPLLWCSLSLHLHRRPGNWKEFLNFWLGRSAQAPLSISFEGCHNQYFNEHIVKVLLKKGVKRWRRLRLDVESSAMTKLLNNSMPMLEILELDVRGAFSGIYLSSADAPRLRTLSLLGQKTDPTHIHVPWGRLTQFHSTVPLALDKYFLVLEKCKSLTRCTIRLSDDGRIATQAILPVCMTRLRSLVVVGSIHQNAVSVFFQNVDLPSLDSLELKHVLHEPFNLKPTSPVVTLARKSNLRRLRLTGGKPIEGLFEGVVAIPSLKEVYIGTTLPPAVQEALDMRK